ncbi:MAG: hypothetical protein IPL86_16720 [Flavobacteriales bacterium]|nr:hypothetical protein [Flavobacteriales bacterium]
MNGFVELITGTLGGGKTLFAVERAFAHAATGGYVYSNIPFVVEAWRAAMAERKRLVLDPGRVNILTAEQTLEFHLHVPRGTHARAVMVIVDEAGLEFNSRDWAKTSKEILAFNTYARKLDIQLLYISQQSADVDKQFRGKCRCEWQCRNLFNLRLFGVIPIKIPLMSRVCYDTTKGKREYLCNDVVSSPKWVWPLYDSDALTGRGKAMLGEIQQVSGTPLERIHVPVESEFRNLILWGVFACSLSVSLF